jgi:type II restriction/modification system DNA methylase subunit YeeA
MIKKLTNDFIDILINEINKENNKEKIKIKVIDPFIYYIMEKLSPYIIITSSVFVLLLILLIIIISLLFKQSIKVYH